MQCRTCSSSSNMQHLNNCLNKAGTTAGHQVAGNNVDAQCQLLLSRRGHHRQPTRHVVLAVAACAPQLQVQPRTGWTCRGAYIAFIGPLLCPGTACATDASMLLLPARQSIRHRPLAVVCAGHLPSASYRYKQPPYLTGLCNCMSFFHNRVNTPTHRILDELCSSGHRAADKQQRAPAA